MEQRILAFVDKYGLLAVQAAIFIAALYTLIWITLFVIGLFSKEEAKNENNDE